MMKIQAFSDPNPRAHVIQSQRNTKSHGETATLPAESGKWITIGAIGEPYSKNSSRHALLVRSDVHREW